MPSTTTPVIALALALSALAAAPPAAAAGYDATTDFSLASNPDGVWSYGYSHLGGASYSMTLFDDPYTASQGIGWRKTGYSSAGAPAIVENTSSGVVDGIRPGQISLHPGPAPLGDFTILRFTAPTTGDYDVTGQFFAGDIGAMNGSIVLAGDLLHPLQFFAVTTDASVFAPLDLQMSRGETLDFVVGNNGNYLYGNTPIEVRIDAASAVPEPGGAALMLAALVTVGVALRRRASSPRRALRH